MFGVDLRAEVGSGSDGSSNGMGLRPVGGSGVEWKSWENWWLEGYRG